MRRNFTAAGEHHAPGLQFAAANAAIAQGELRVVFPHCFCTDEDRVRTHAQSATMGTRGIVGDPLAFTGRTSDTTVETLTRLGDDVGQAGGDPFGEGPDEILAFSFQHSGGDFDAREQEDVAALVEMFGIGIMRTEDDALDACGLDCFGARRGAALRAAGFECDEDRGAGQQLRIELLRITNRLDLGMRLTDFVMIALTDDFVLCDDHRSHGRIRARQTDSALRLIERQVHPALVGSFVFVGGGGHAGRA